MTSSSSFHLSRRKLLGTAGAATAIAATGAYKLAGSASAAAVLPAPDDSGIEHVVVVMMENRSFDHFLGWLPGADGKQAGMTYLDRYRVPHDTYHLDIFASCGYNDPDHSYEGGRVQLNGGRCNGWLRSGLNDTLAIGYYEQADLAFLGQAVPQWTTFDRYFSAVMAETYPNRFYQHCAQTDRLHNSISASSMRSIWDNLKDAGVSGKYYFNDAPFALLLGSHAPEMAYFADFVADCAAGTLPAVSFVDPKFNDEGDGTSGDDHPHADIRMGEDFLNQVYNAVTTGPGWEKTVLIINYDEWGGFFDHVAPTRAHDVSRKTSLRGFRVPAVMISPLARRNFVSHVVYDHTSILKMIEWRWGLPHLTPRDQYAHNIAAALDFVNPPDLSAPTYDVPPFVSAGCSVSAAEANGPEAREWGGLVKMAEAHGWTPN